MLFSPFLFYAFSINIGGGWLKSVTNPEVSDVFKSKEKRRIYSKKSTV